MNKRLTDEILKYELRKERIQDALDSEEINYSQARYLRQKISKERMMDMYSHLPISEQIEKHQEEFEYFTKDLRVYMPLGAYTHMAMVCELMRQKMKNKYCG